MDRSPRPAQPLATFLVERYWPDVDLAVLQAALPRLEAEARAMTAEGSPVTHVSSILMPADQVVFSLIAADGEASVRRLHERAAMPLDRLARAIELRSDPLLPATSKRHVP